MRWLGGQIALAASLIGCAGCGYSELHQVVFRTSPPTGRSIEVYMVGQPAPRPFDELALLQIVSTGNQAEPRAVLAALSQRAAELGCDAMVRVRVDTGVTATHGYGVCVRTQEARAPAP
ncbi:MAG TPA: hypothetical protein VF316_06385 [Polyangiaceae bacterium]